MALLLVTAPARAEHEANHRYVILGYVKDANGRPLERALVEVVRVKTGLAYRETSDRDGLYALIVNLHDEDLGDSLEVSTRGRSATVKAEFNPRDSTTERGTRIDFVGQKIEDRRSWFLATLKQYLAK